MGKVYKYGKIPFQLIVICALAGLPLLFLMDQHTPAVGLVLVLFFMISLMIPFGRTGAIAAAVITAVFCLFQFRLCHTLREYLPFPADQICHVDGTLSEDPIWRDSQTIIVKIRLDTCNSLSGNSAAAIGNISYRLTMPLNTPVIEQLYRSVPVSLGGADFSLYSRHGRLYASGGNISADAPAGPDSIRQEFLNWMQEKSGLLSSTAEVLLPALLAGMEHPQKERIQRIFRESGTAHIMALSGFHAGLIGILLFSAGRLLFGFRVACLFSLAGLSGYLWLAGFSPSLTRAVVMYGFFILARLSYRRFNPLSVLLCSYYLTAILFPLSLQTLSSQLSYLALSGILLTARRLNTLTQPYFPRWIRLPLSVSLGAQIWTGFIVLRTFGVLYPAGLGASLILTPLVTVYVYTGILWLVLPSGAFTVRLFSLFMGGLEKLIFRGGEFFAAFPPVRTGQSWAGPFLLFLIPVLLLEFYRPGRVYGKGKTGFKLRFGFRNQNPAGYDGVGAPKTLGAEFPDKPGSKREDHLPYGYSGE